MTRDAAKVTKTKVATKFYLKRKNDNLYFKKKRNIGKVNMCS